MRFGVTAVILAGLVAGGCSGERGGDPAGTSGEASVNAEGDPYLWLEEVDGGRALDWVRARNAECVRELAETPGFEALRARLLGILDSTGRIPHVAKRGRYLYNFWRDAKNVRGVWRRTTMAEYRKPEPAWETVIDVDRLAAEEKENWVWHGADFLEPSFDRCMVVLSRGGCDASVRREFDVERREFVAGGFVLPEAKSRTSWLDRDTLYVGTDFGPGSLTRSGYPRTSREWKRGTPLASAPVVFEGAEADVAASVSAERDHGRLYVWASRATAFFSSEISVLRAGRWVRVEKPADAELSTFGDWLLLHLRTSWTAGGRTWPAGALIAANFDAWLDGDRRATAVYEPSPRRALARLSATRSFLVLHELDNVRARAWFVKPQDGAWKRTPVEVPEFGVAEVSGLDAEESDEFFLVATDFLHPSTLSLGTAGAPGVEPLKAAPAHFRADGLEIRQFEAVSRDGTRVPWFLVARRGLPADGSTPTILHGYGGFEVSMLPGYSGVLGAAWLESGGAWALANIRGGGEFGPEWHNAALRENRQRAYDDFIAVAQDIAARGIASPRHLGASGRSNGGLLMGNMITQRPELFRAIACGNPLLDMKRYHRLLAGASWVAEYGDPDDPADWDFLRRYSAYHNLSKDRPAPRVLFTTSTRDDRVHPGHARKMAARMRELGHDVRSYENIEGGHGSASNNAQAAFMEALMYEFFRRELK